VVDGDLDLHGRGIGDAEIHDSAPLVRALVVQRAEKLWRSVEPYCDGELSKPDPRFIEAGIRLLDRLAKVYRLDQPVPSSEGSQGDLIPVSQLVLKQLEELEQRQGL
jgi:hypothetical protein